MQDIPLEGSKKQPQHIVETTPESRKCHITIDFSLDKARIDPDPPCFKGRHGDKICLLVKVPKSFHISESSGPFGPPLNFEPVSGNPQRDGLNHYTSEPMDLPHCSAPYGYFVSVERSRPCSNEVDSKTSSGSIDVSGGGDDGCS